MLNLREVDRIQLFGDGFGDVRVDRAERAAAGLVHRAFVVDVGAQTFIECVGTVHRLDDIFEGNIGGRFRELIAAALPLERFDNSARNQLAQNLE